LLTEQLYYAIAIEIGKKIRSRRKDCELTQFELGYMVGYSQKTIAAFENGYRVPNAVTIRMLAIALHCQPADLI